MKKVLVIAGPTASGKTDFAVEAAERLNGEVISGDSIQVYRGLDIGSGKVTKEEMRGIPHHLIDILSPFDNYSAADFQQAARKIIDESEKPMIICGGTGLYLKACLYDYVFEEEEEEAADPELEAMDNEALYALLQRTDPVQAEKIHPNNRRRVIRSLTIGRRSGRRQSDIVAAQSHEMIYDAFIAGCTMPRPQLYQKINRRVELMFEAGLQKEVERLLDEGVTFNHPCMKGIGYREWEGFFYGGLTSREVMEEIQKHSRQFAKRQYTWLNHQMPVRWFTPGIPQEREQMLVEIENWINGVCTDGQSISSDSLTF